MTSPPELLVITHNRLPYAERTLRNLFADSSEFHVHLWDNASTDGTAELVAGWDDARIQRRHLSSENLLQDAPTRWFLRAATADLIGKVDDDTLVPPGWVDVIGPAIRDHEALGMVGCWTFMLEDFDRNRANALRKLVTLGSYQVIHDIAIGGTGFLMRRELADRYIAEDTGGRSFPVDRALMTRDGWISGWLFPLLLAEHMDDPRSEYCLMNASGTVGEHAALTARARGFATPQQYLDWIIDDVDNKMARSVERQLRDHRRRTSLLGRSWRRIRGGSNNPARMSPDGGASIAR